MTGALAAEILFKVAVVVFMTGQVAANALLKRRQDEERSAWIFRAHELEQRIRALEKRGES